MRENNPGIINEFLGQEICGILDQMHYPDFYKRITYVILKFFESEERILFFQVPNEELTYNNNERAEDSYWNEFCDVIAYAIRLAMKSGRLCPTQCPYPGDWYRNGDNFLLLSAENERYPYYFLNGDRDRHLSFRCVNENTAPTKTQKNQLLQNARAIYQLIRIPNQINNGYNNCCDEIRLLNCDRFVNNQFASAVEICPAIQGQMSLAGRYVMPIVNICNARNNYPDSDIVAIVGDYAFDRIQGALNSLTPRGRTSKLILVGTLPPVCLLNNNPFTITLSFREIYNYFAPRRVEYVNPTFVEIEFPWLVGTLNSLRTILEPYQERLGNETYNHIYELSKSWLTDMRFNNEELERFKAYFESFIYDAIGNDNLLNDAYEAIIDWSTALEYDSVANPKQDYARAHGITNVVYRKRSIRRQVRDFENGSRILMDAPYHGDYNRSNPISEVMRYVLFPNLSCVYYRDIETHRKNSAERYLARDPFFYERNDDADYQEPDNNTFNLEEYLDWERRVGDSCSRIYNTERVSFADGTQDRLSGDVLISNEDGSLNCVPYADITERVGTTITYYAQNNDNNQLFDQLVTNYYVLDNRNIEYYVELWQNAFRELINNNYNGSIEQFANDFGINANVCRNHLNGTSRFMNNNPFNRVLEALRQNRLISPEERRYIIAAKRFYNGSAISFGSRLKEALYQFAIDNQFQSDFLRILEERTGHNATYLAENFLFTKTINA